MTDVSNFTITRKPDDTINCFRIPHGWTLQPSSNQKLCSLSEMPPKKLRYLSPATFLLSDELINSIKPLKKWSSKFPQKVLDTINSESIEQNQSSRFNLVFLFDQLYSDLHEAYHEKNALLIEEIASQHLKEHPIKTYIELDATTQRIYRFFNQKDCKTTQQEYLCFYNSIREKDILSYLSNLSLLIDEIKCQILASHILGELGQNEYNLIDALRSILAFLTLVLIVYKEDYKDNMPIKYICTILDLYVYLPDWTYNIDTCNWKEDDSYGAVIKTNPLAKRIAEKLAYKDKLQVNKTKQAIRDNSNEKNIDESGIKRHFHPDCQPTESGDPDCNCIGECNNPPCLPQSPCCAEINYYVTDLMVLREETMCYKPSDIAYIENVAKKEYRQRTHHFVKTIEDYTEEEKTNSHSEHRDQQVTNRFSLQKAIDDQVSRSLNVVAEVSGAAYSITTNTSLSKDVAQSEAREIFREAVNKASIEIQSKSRKLQTHRKTIQESEKNKHRVNNDTDKPLVTKSFWVTHKKEGRVFSYGKRGTLEILLPSPAFHYEHLEKLKSEREFDIKKPMHPCLNVEDISPSKYNDYINEYGLYDLPKPPVQPPVKYIYIHARRDDGSIPISIPNGYTIVIFERIRSSLSRKWGQKSASIQVSFAGTKVEHKINGIINASNTFTSPSAQISVRASVSAIVIANDATSDSYIDVKFTLNPDQVDISEWQLTVLKSIMEKYQEEMNKYEEALAEHKSLQQDKLIQGKHAFAAKEIMDEEIKRAVIYMLCDEFDNNNAMNMKSEPCGYPEINRSVAGVKTWDWYFFDRAFDWKLMSYKFFDYFRNPKCSWPDKFDPGDPNFMFNAFLRAGYCRVQLPITKKMESDVIHFLNTKEKWNSGGTVPQNPSDPRWLSIIEEIKHSYETYQNDREGFINSIVDTANNNTNQVLIIGSDRYWDEILSIVNQSTINLDLDYEIFIDGIAYRLINIQPDPNSPPYSPVSGSDMRWIVTLNRVFESEALADITSGILKNYNYAIGAKFIGAPFLFELPTNLIWVGDYDNICLPCYPIECVLEENSTSDQVG